jgi:aldehyde:ferredoxin oxidoreductase
MSAKAKYRILRVDLTDRKTNMEELDEGTVRKFLGGSGLSAKLLWEETKAHTEPLSEENILVFADGPVSGTPFPSSSRLTVAAISPLTNIMGEVHIGGTVGASLSRTGCMAIVVTGRASKPVYILVRDGEGRIADASHIWGRDTFETDAILKKETSGRASVATIGPAGENLVRYATVMADGPVAHTGGRCGLGAVMGSKNLKAVVFEGTTKPEIYDEEGLRKSIEKYFPKTRVLKQEEKDSKAARGYRERWVSERASIKNFQLGEFEGFAQKMEELEEKYRVGEPRFCPHCINGCKSIVMLDGKRLNHGECTMPMGSNCLISDLEALDQAFDICNRCGLDTISAGDAIAFAMELFEKGVITGEHTEGIELTWGNHEAMLQILQKIVKGEGFGKLLGLGVARAAAEIGGVAPEYAIHVKGLELSLHDPRSWNHYALQMATANRGGDHTDGFVGLYAQSIPGFQPHAYGFTHLEDEKAREAYDKPFATEGVGKLVAWSQDFTAVLDSLVVCHWIGLPGIWVRKPTEPFGGVQPEHIAEWLDYVTGWEVDLRELMKIGERNFNLKRLFNVRRGISRKDDTLPQRLLTCKRGGSGPAAENLPHLGKMLNEYYLWRGWSEEGIPTKKKLAELALL